MIKKIEKNTRVLCGILQKIKIMHFIKPVMKKFFFQAYAHFKKYKCFVRFNCSNMKSFLYENLQHTKSLIFK